MPDEMDLEPYRLIPVQTLQQRLDEANTTARACLAEMREIDISIDDTIWRKNAGYDITLDPALLRRRKRLQKKLHAAAVEQYAIQEVQRESRDAWQLIGCDDFLDEPS